MEYIDSMQFYYFIKTKIFNELLFSTIKQLLMAIYISQTKKRFTHYDLHSCNVMMRKCSKDDVFLYVLDDEINCVYQLMGIIQLLSILDLVISKIWIIILYGHH